MKLVRIFVSEESENGLWSIHLDRQAKNEFDSFFDLMNDIEWLHNFFQANEQDLNAGFYGKISVGDAVLRTLQEVQEMEDALYEFTEQGFSGDVNLQHLFKPLNNFEYAINVHQKSKARVRKGWLRLYAIRLDKNCYLVTGGAIKLTSDMRRTHLLAELEKLEQAKSFLRSNGIAYPEDLNTFQDE
jgi:hypothetical protein